MSDFLDLAGSEKQSSSLTSSMAHHSSVLILGPATSFLKSPAHCQNLPVSGSTCWRSRSHLNHQHLHHQTSVYCCLFLHRTEKKVSGHRKTMYLCLLIHLLQADLVTAFLCNLKTYYLLDCYIIIMQICLKFTVLDTLLLFNNCPILFCSRWDWKIYTITYKLVFYSIY